MTNTPDQHNTAPVQAQLDAYNAKDIDAFCRCYHPDITIYRMPASTPVLQGLDALRQFYASERLAFGVEPRLSFMSVRLAQAPSPASAVAVVL